MDEWKYYNNALIPTTPPHISPSVPSKGFWKALKSSMCVGGGQTTSLCKMDNRF